MLGALTCTVVATVERVVHDAVLVIDHPPLEDYRQGGWYWIENLAQPQAPPSVLPILLSFWALLAARKPRAFYRTWRTSR
jgi:hypothetical protein